MKAVGHIGMYIALIGVAALIVAGTFILPTTGIRDTGELETIHGISYPVDSEGVRVVEKLAHTDVYLNESVFAKSLRVSFEFLPGNTTSLAVGVRENPFWLSYPKNEFWNGEGKNEWQAVELTIPLTDKLQEPNRSLDMMFFAQTTTSSSDVDEGIADTVDWHIRNFEVSVEPSVPTLSMVKDFARALLTQEKAL